MTPETSVVEEKVVIEKPESFDSKKIKDHEIAQKLVHLRQSAMSRHIDFDLSFKTMKRLLTQKTCFYTGVPFSSKNKRSIDRVDSALGYIEGNVVACTVDINGKKTNLSIQEILKMAEKIKLHQKKFKKKNILSKG